MVTATQELVQGTPEWLALRKTKITATDSRAIMGVDPWKTPLQLYKDKLSPAEESTKNERMQRGLDLEPVARDLFYIKTGHRMEPKIVVKDWLMASLDGINNWNEILEIKCPGEQDHSIALSGKVPEHYYPQLQHQLAVCDSEKAFYFSFDGIDGVIIEVKRDDIYIEKMLIQERKFYDNLINKIPPEPTERDYLERNDDTWKQCASEYQYVTSAIKNLESQQDDLRHQLTQLAGSSNARGAGISVCQVHRKGNINYEAVLKHYGIDDNLDRFRKPASTSWRISVS